MRRSALRWVRSVLVVAGKDFRLSRSYRLAFPLSVFSAFFGLLGFRFVSKLVDTGQFHGSSTLYFRYTVVGLVVGTLIQQAAMTPSAAARQDQVQGTLEYLASQPLSRSALGYGWGFYAIVQNLIVSVAACLLFWPIGFTLHVTNAPAALVALVLILVLFASLGNVGAAAVVAFQQGQQVVTAVCAGLGLISGTLFPVGELPTWLRPLGHASPLYAGLNVLRSSILAGQPRTLVAQDLLILAAWTVVAVPVSVAILEGAFRHAQRRGSLSTF